MCDQDIIDSVLEEGNVYIDIKSYSDFYKGKIINSKKPGTKIDKNIISSSNIIGNDSVKLAISWGIISEDNVMLINNIKYAQSYKVGKRVEQK